MTTLTGEVKGKHDVLMYHTIGQRQGLGIGGSGDPWFVVGKNVEDNILYVEQGFAHEGLYSDGIIASDINWINREIIDDKILCKSIFNYRQKHSRVYVIL